MGENALPHLRIRYRGVCRVKDVQRLFAGFLKQTGLQVLPVHTREKSAFGFILYEGELWGFPPQKNERLSGLSQ